MSSKSKDLSTSSKKHLGHPGISSQTQVQELRQLIVYAKRTSQMTPQILSLSLRRLGRIRYWQSAFELPAFLSTVTTGIFSALCGCGRCVSHCQWMGSSFRMVGRRKGARVASHQRQQRCECLYFALQVKERLGNNVRIAA